ncbi:hypothetical protein COOONC_01850 [Cooperia oncophora]
MKKVRKKVSEGKTDSGITLGGTKMTPEQSKHSGKKSVESGSKSGSGKGHEKGKPLMLQQLTDTNIFPLTMAELERQQVKEFNMHIDKLAMKKSKSGSVPSSLMSTMI